MSASAAALPVMQDEVGRWPTPVPNLTAEALAEILSLATDPALEDHASGIEAIADIARKALAFDPERMRLRIDDLHGNRSFVQRVDGIWKAFRIDGMEVRFSYCFGHPCDDAGVVRDLSMATTIHSVERAAMGHVKGLQNVQVEAVWERHRWDGERLRHIPR